MQTLKHPSTGWKRLWIAGTAIWVIQALVLAAVFFVVVLEKNSQAIWDAKNMVSLLGMGTAYLILPPLLANWTARGIARLARGKTGLHFSDLSSPRKAWFILAGILYVVSFLPGLAGMFFGPLILTAKAVSEPIGAKPPAEGLVFALVTLPQWFAYTLGSYVIMRGVDWIWGGFNQT